MAAFLAVASGAAPVESWYSLHRETEEHFGITYYRPGWMGGGLFMQTQDGLFLNEYSTPAGRSAANFAYAQMIYAKTLNFDAWGWSACSSPEGVYLGYGGLDVEVVTPHAAEMSVMFYPHKAVECLKELEKRGARKPLKIGDQSFDLGFLDSINLKTGKIREIYIPCLDQAMGFLAIANVLENGIVHRLFEESPMVQKGMNLIDEYSWPLDQGWLAELKKRDESPVPDYQTSSTPGKSPILVDDFENPHAKTNLLGGEYLTWTRDSNDPTFSIAISNQVMEKNHREKNRCLKIDYDVDSPNPAAFGGFHIFLLGTDGSGCDGITFWAKGTPDNIKFELHGPGGVGVTRIKGIKPDKWTKITVPFYQFGGMISNWSNLDRITLVFEDSTSVPKTGTLYLDDIAFVKIK